MNKTIAAVVVLVIIAIGTYYLVFSGHSSTTSTDNSNAGNYVPTTPLPTSPTTPPPQTSTVPTPATPPKTSTTPAPSVVAISIKGFAFNPAMLSVKTGTKVTWTNNDSAPHTVTSDSGGLLNSPTLAPGQSFSFTFTTPGSVSYHCTIHPTMKATVSVTN